MIFITLAGQIDRQSVPPRRAGFAPAEKRESYRLPLVCRETKRSIVKERTNV